MEEEVCHGPLGFTSQDLHVFQVFPDNCMVLRGGSHEGRTLLTSFCMALVDNGTLPIESDTPVGLPQPHGVCNAFHQTKGVVLHQARHSDSGGHWWQWVEERWLKLRGDEGI